MSGAAPARSSMSIGEVLAILAPDFPDVTISKIRFLESEGLIEPERTPAGYRKFTHADVERLRFVLSAQRDYYLPLRVIREHLSAIDQGRPPPEGPLAGAALRLPRTLASAAGGPGSDAAAAAQPETRLSRDELRRRAGIGEAELVQLENFGLVAARPGGHYDSDALLIAKTAAEMGGFGIEPRHLRSFKAAADREAGLVEQVVAPLLRQRSPEARARAAEAVRELSTLSLTLHATLVRAGLRPALGGR